MTPAPDHQPVRLSLPAHARFLSAARVVAATLGADAGLSVDDLDDLRLGVNELVAALIELAAPDASVVVELVTQDSVVTVTGAIEGSTSGPLAADELTRRILDAVADGYELGATSFVLTKASSLRERT